MPPSANPAPALVAPLVPLAAEIPGSAGTAAVYGGPCPEPDAQTLAETSSASGQPGIVPASAPPAPSTQSAPPTPSNLLAALPPPTAASPPPPSPIIAGPPLGFNRALGIPRTPYGKQIYKVALRYALNPLVMAAVVEAESDFRPRAVSRKGACGLMQVLPSTARRFGYRRRDLFNPMKNLEAGARYLRWLVNRFGDDAMRVLAAYNAGEGSVERFGGLPPFQETRDYVQHIFTRLGFTLAVHGNEPAPFVGTR